MSVESCCYATYYTILPYARALHHVGDACEKWDQNRAAGCLKAICVAGGAVIGAGLTIGLSPKMYEAFYNANKKTDESTCTLSCQTDTGLKIGAGLCVTMVDAWGLSFGAMVGGEIGDKLISAGYGMANCCQKVSASASNCFARLRTACCGAAQPAATGEVTLDQRV